MSIPTRWAWDRAESLCPAPRLCRRLTDHTQSSEQRGAVTPRSRQKFGSLLEVVKAKKGETEEEGARSDHL
jgi:hypothetical protein